MRKDGFKRNSHRKQLSIKRSEAFAALSSRPQQHQQPGFYPQTRLRFALPLSSCEDAPQQKMVFRTVTLGVLCAVLFNTVTSTSFRCSVDDGVSTFLDSDNQKFTPDRFHCLKITTDSPSTLQVSPPLEFPPGHCSALQDGKASVKVKYEEVDFNTGIMCTLECKVEPNRYRCTEKASDNLCRCEAKTPIVIVKPISSELGPGPLIGGQSDLLNEGAQTCDDKAVGFEFPDGVPCISIRADVTKRRVNYIENDEGRCLVSTRTEPETRYMETSPDNVNLQGCVYQCKMAGPRCYEPESETRCKCASPGMTKQLVLMDHLEVAERFGQECDERMENEDCGPCGTCHGNVCVLKTNAHLEKRCDCGMICPSEDTRIGDLGSPLVCVPNTKLQCMGKREEYGNRKRKYVRGTENPDLCTDGKTNAADTCGCAVGYDEQPGPEQSTKCVKIEG